MLESGAGRLGNPENYKASARLNRRCFFARNVAEPPITFCGGCYWEAGRLIRNLVDGVSNLIATPALRLETEGGIMGKLQGGHTMAKRPLIRALGYIPAIPNIYTAPKLHPAPAVHSAF